MKKLFSYLLISSMVVLSSCTNYDDQFDDLNTQINTLKSQIEGFSSLSSGLTALQGTVASLQTAINNIPVTPATDISGLESTQAALQTALTALATEVTALQTSLAAADSSAQVAQLALDLAAAQADLTKLLASNNVYSDDVVINSSATLAVAKSLGDKLTILNADLIIDQDATMSATDLQSVLDVIVTTTGNIQYKMASKSSTVANFSKLTSAANIFVDVAGAISFPLLENVTTLHIDDTHSAYITSFSAPVLTKITTFATGGSSAYDASTKIVTIAAVLDANKNKINLPKATAITLSALATYDAGSLSITGKLDHALDLKAITSKTAVGASQPFSLTSVGAKEISLPLITKGTVIANTSEIINLPLFIGNAADSFSGAETITLGAYTQDLTTGTALKTITFTGAKAEGAASTAVGPDVDVSASTSINSLTVAGVVDSVTANFIAANTTLETVSLTGKANAVTFNNANGLTSLSLGHTAEQALLASLTVTNNTAMASLDFDKLASAASLTITGNDVLTTISADALKTVGGLATAAASVDVSDNDFTATQSEITAAAVGTTLAKGTFTSTSGMKDLSAYLIAAVTRYGTAGGTVYAAFDTLDSYLSIDDVPDPNAPFTWATKGGESKLEVVYMSNAGYTAATSSSTGVTKAKRSFVLDLASETAFDFYANGNAIETAVTLSNNASLAAATIADAANVATAAALGVTLSASNQARGIATITFTAGRDNTQENSPTLAADIAKLVGANTFNASSTVVLNIQGQTVTLSDTTSTGSNVTEVADELVDLYNAKYTDNTLRNYDLTASTGVITVKSTDLGSGGIGDSVSVTVGELTGTASLTNLGVVINELDSNVSGTDNVTQPTASTVLITFEAVTAGSPLSEIGYPGKALVATATAKSVEITGTTSKLTVTELTSSVTSNAQVDSGASTATNLYPNDSRADVRYPDAAVVTTTGVVGSLKTHNQTSWL